MENNLSKIYGSPLKSSRSGALFMAFSYPTKISPETIAVYILAHTKPGQTVLDVFGGSGTTGMAALLCDQPNDKVKAYVQELGIEVEYGPRNCVIGELSGIGSFLAEVMCSGTSANLFEDEANKLLERASDRLSHLYETVDPKGKKSQLRHVVHSDFVICSNCEHEYMFGKVCATVSPAAVKPSWTCPNCSFSNDTSTCRRAVENVWDDLLVENVSVRKRRPFLVYGQTGKEKWRREANESDSVDAQDLHVVQRVDQIPLIQMNWGDLYRSGYHYGITHLHQLYTKRNLAVMSVLWDEVENSLPNIQDALKLWILSYNSSHSTLMTRVVVKSKEKDFVLTGAQSGVLYISSLPVEKNILLGLKRKVSTFKNALAQVEGSRSRVEVKWGSSVNLSLDDSVIDYVFTDPPFGDYIPYSEINFINEAWLNRTTNQVEEAIVSTHQRKSPADYQKLLSTVFQEVNRVTTDNAVVSLVFHSASSKIWNALNSSISEGGFGVDRSSVLDKDQASFKQTNSEVAVKGDAILMLNKNTRAVNAKTPDIDSIVERLVNAASNKSADELTRERLYSRFVGYCMENEIELTIGAKEFYQRLSHFEIV